MPKEQAIVKEKRKENVITREHFDEWCLNFFFKNKIFSICMKKWSEMPYLLSPNILTSESKPNNSNLDSFCVPLTPPWLGSDASLPSDPTLTFLQLHKGHANIQLTEKDIGLENNSKQRDQQAWETHQNICKITEPIKRIPVQKFMVKCLAPGYKHVDFQCKNLNLSRHNV